MVEKEGKRPHWLADDDDGRTIADMSGVRRRNLWIPRRYKDEDQILTEGEDSSASAEMNRGKNRVVEQNGQIMDEAEANGYRPWEESGLNKKETRSIIFGATAAGLVLVGLFIVAGWLLIRLLLWAWN